MADSRNYLNVPYAEKDAAKALGARWDAANKKWYAPAGTDPTVFRQWLTDDSSPRSKTNSAAFDRKPFAENSASGAFTKPEVKDFVAYNGVEPPWD